MSTVVSVENLGKKYNLHHQQCESSYTALRDVIANGFVGVVRKLRHPFQSSSLVIPSEEEFWALKDVSFEVKQGDRIGIIGRNGAGKSTLLKILSRITEPTTGRVKIKGRVASLLEVGTGFHPELTGRENIFLNGAILGMSRGETKKKFDEIVSFAEIEKFLDTPVKRYSSGMYVRLAFAVAAHLEPEILIVDEVLAVGDAQFQKKCLGRMEYVSAREDRTVLFVSHNMGAIAKLCSHALLLENGSMYGFDQVGPMIRTYLDNAVEGAAFWKRCSLFPVTKGIYFEEIRILAADGNISNFLPSMEPFSLSLAVRSTGYLHGTQIAVRVTNQDGIPVLTTTNCDASKNLRDICQGRYRFTVQFPSSFFPPGRYSLIIASFVPGVKLFDSVEDELAFQIEDLGTHATTMNDGRLGVVTPLFLWEEIFDD